jgi:hypothetical protein
MCQDNMALSPSLLKIGDLLTYHSASGLILLPDSAPLSGKDKSSENITVDKYKATS